MGVKTLECWLEFPFQMSAIHFPIEQESDFQPENDEPKHPLISFWYSSFKSIFTALSKSSRESEITITCHRLLHHILHGPKCPIQNVLGKFTKPPKFRPF